MWDALLEAPQRGGLAGEIGCIMEMLEEEVRALMLSLSSSLSVNVRHDKEEEELLVGICILLLAMRTAP
jgi:hypothetical protein